MFCGWNGDLNRLLGRDFITSGWFSMQESLGSGRSQDLCPVKQESAWFLGKRRRQKKEICDSNPKFFLCSLDVRGRQSPSVCYICDCENKIIQRITTFHSATDI